MHLWTAVDGGGFLRSSGLRRSWSSRHLDFFGTKRPALQMESGF